MISRIISPSDECYVHYILMLSIDSAATVTVAVAVICTVIGNVPPVITVSSELFLLVYVTMSLQVVLILYTTIFLFFSLQLSI